MGRKSFFAKLWQSPRRAQVALLAVPIAAVLVRLPGTWQNLPFVFHWDEPTLVNLATWLFTEGSLNPRFFNYPGGMIYFLGLLYLLAILGGVLLGTFPGWAAGLKVLAAGTYPRPPGGGILYRFPTRGSPPAYIVGRLASVVLGALSAWWAARLAERLAGRRAAWLAGGFLALNALHASNSVLVTTDVACGAFLAWFLLVLTEGRSPRTAGIALGLAAAFKYTGGIGIYLWPLGLLLTPVFGSTGSARGAAGSADGATGPAGGGAGSADRATEPAGDAAGSADGATGPVGRATGPADRARGTATAAAASAVDDSRARRADWNRFWKRLLPWAAGTFLLLNPFAVLSPGAFLRGFFYEAAHMRAGTEHFGEGIGIGPTGPSVVGWTLWRDFGPLALIAILLALLMAVPANARPKPAGSTRSDSPMRLDQRWIFLLAAWCAVYLLQLCTWRTAYPRYLLPLWPPLAVLAGCGASMVAEQVLRQQGKDRVRSARRAAMVVAAALLVGPGLYPLCRSVVTRLRTDPRVPMSAVLAASVKAGEGIGVEPGGPWISGEWNQTVGADLLGRNRPDAWRRQGVRYLVATGREAFLPAGSPDSLRANRERIERESKVLWMSGPYAIYDLGEGEGDVEGVRTLLAAGRMPEAERRARALWAADPTSVSAAMLVGEVLEARQDTIGALDAYQRAAVLAPRDPTPLLATGQIALSVGDWNAAIEAFSLAAERSGRDPVAVHNLATALLYRARAAGEVGRLAEAAEDLRAALRFSRAAVSLDPEDARFRETEVHARELAGRFRIRLDGAK